MDRLAGRFEIQTFKAGDESVVCWQARVLPPPPRLIRVPIEAQVRAISELEQPSSRAVRDAVGGPGWTAEGGEADQDRAALIPSGSYRPGQTVLARGDALFDDLRPGWRLRLFGRRDDPEVAPCL